MDNLKIDYKEETIIAFTNMIRTIINSEVDAILKKSNIEQFDDVQVTRAFNDVSGANSDYPCADLRDMVTGETYTSVPNHTGVKLYVGDVVRMYHSQSGNYIGLTFGNRNDGFYKDYINEKLQSIKGNK